MYLLIGFEHDPCCRIIHSLLKDLGYCVHLTAEPLVSNHMFTWALDTQRSVSSWSAKKHVCITDHAWSGVLLRGYGVPVDATNWVPEDYTYTCMEAQAALFAWLHTLTCPVVNRLSADLWFFPQRSLVAWQSHLVRAGLPTPVAQITNDFAAARRFAARWQGNLTYTPLTSKSRYTIATDVQWSELAQIMRYLPVALYEPLDESSIWVSVVGDEIIWNNNPQLSSTRFAEIEAGLRRLARSLRLTMVQIELGTGPQGPRCIDIDIFPRFDVYSDDIQHALGEAIVRQLVDNRCEG